MRRAGIFAHFDPQDVVDPYVVRLLGELRSVCQDVSFISTSALSAAELAKVGHLADRIELRDNVGHDFGSYRRGILTLRDQSFDEIVIMNDSVYGPLQPLPEVFADMEVVAADCWSATASLQDTFHLQSYFMVFRRRVLESPVFWLFWKHLDPPRDKIRLVRACEMGLSRLLTRQGLRLVSFLPPASLIDGFRHWLDPSEQGGSGRFRFVSDPRQLWRVYRLVRHVVYTCQELGVHRAILNLRNYNPTLTFSLHNLKSQRMLFVKVVLLRDNPLQSDVRNCFDSLRRYTRFDPQLIIAHLRRLGIQTET